MPLRYYAAFHHAMLRNFQPVVTTPESCLLLLIFRFRYDAMIDMLYYFLLLMPVCHRTVITLFTPDFFDHCFAGNTRTGHDNVTVTLDCCFFFAMQHKRYFATRYFRC